MNYKNRCCKTNRLYLRQIFIQTLEWVKDSQDDPEFHTNSSIQTLSCVSSVICWSSLHAEWKFRVQRIDIIISFSLRHLKKRLIWRLAFNILTNFQKQVNAKWLDLSQHKSAFRFHPKFWLKGASIVIVLHYKVI